MRLSIVFLSIVMSISFAHGEDSCFGCKPVRKAWNGMARYLGICYSHGYHVCKSCGAKCSSPSCGCGAQAFVQPGVISNEMNYVPAQMVGPGMVGPGAPSYMMHGQTIPDQYNEEIVRPERQYTPNLKQPTLAVPSRPEAQAPRAPMRREMLPPVAAQAPASPSDAPSLSASGDSQLERAPAPESLKPIESSARPEPTRGSGITASTPETLPTPRPVTEPAPLTAPAPLTGPRPLTAPAPLAAPANNNDDDLLVPPDTSLLDSISYPRHRSPYYVPPTPRTARIVAEPAQY